MVQCHQGQMVEKLWSEVTAEHAWKLHAPVPHLQLPSGASVPPSLHAAFSCAILFSLIILLLPHQEPASSISRCLYLSALRFLSLPALSPQRQRRGTGSGGSGVPLTSLKPHSAVDISLPKVSRCAPTYPWKTPGASPPTPTHL